MIRERLVIELQRSVGSMELAYEFNTENQLRQLIPFADADSYRVEILMELPQDRFLEGISLLLFKKPLQENAFLRYAGRLTQRSLARIWLTSLLPGRHARINGLFITPR